MSSLVYNPARKTTHVCPYSRQSTSYQLLTFTPTMVFDPTVYENTSITPVPFDEIFSDDEWDSVDDEIAAEMNEFDDDYGLDALSALIISYEIPFYGPVLNLPQNEFLNRMELIDELDIALTNRQCGVPILREPIRG